MKIDRMELDDCGSPERLLVAIFKQVPDMPIPVPLDEIASQVGITEIRMLETDGFEGGLLTNAAKSSGAILVNARSNKFRRRFTIGHELGHFLIPAHKPPAEDGFRCTQKDFARISAAPGNRAVLMEVEANRFSAGLLLPARAFRQDMEQLRGHDVAHIVQLSKRYQASKEAIARKYVEHHDEACAVVISNNGKIVRIY